MQDYSEDDIYHVLPVNDILQHTEEEYCRCRPRVDVYENGVVVVHQAFDLRGEFHPQEN